MYFKELIIERGFKCVYCEDWYYYFYFENRIFVSYIQGGITCGELGVGYGMGAWRYECNYRRKELLGVSYGGKLRRCFGNCDN